MILMTELRGLCLGIEAPCHVNPLIGPIDWTMVCEGSLQASNHGSYYAIRTSLGRCVEPWKIVEMD